MKSTELVKVIHVTPEFHKRLKIAAAYLDSGISVVAMEALESYLEKIESRPDYPSTGKGRHEEPESN